MPLFELANYYAQEDTVEVGTSDGHPVLRLRDGGTISAETVEELNRLLADHTAPAPAGRDEGG